MASPEKVYREFVRRINRAMAAYLAVMAWTQGADCVVLDRDDIVRFWDLKRRVESERLAWLRTDVKQFFPHMTTVQFPSRKFGGVYLSRIPFPDSAFAESMTDKVRAKHLTGLGVATSIISLPSEAEIISLLTTVCHGLGKVPATSVAATA